jgi:hypothetical protein
LVDFFDVDLVLATAHPRFVCWGIWSECGGTVAARIVAALARVHHTGAMIDGDPTSSVESSMGSFMRAVSQATTSVAVAVALIGFAAAVAHAQTAAPSQTAPAATAAPVAAGAVAAPAVAAAPKLAAKARECTRLPLSDIQVGKDKTIEVARLRLDEYVAKVGKQRGWKSWDKSLETVACEDYLYVPLLGQEYKCLVTATFCKKS